MTAVRWTGRGILLDKAVCEGQQSPTKRRLNAAVRAKPPIPQNLNSARRNEKGSALRKTDIDTVMVIAAAAVTLIMLPGIRRGPQPEVLAAETASQPIAIDYPLNRSIFPPDITPPTFLWHDPAAASRWRIEFRFGDGTPAMSFETAGPHPIMGAIDQRCISTTNELPKL
ncbi:MAG: hypothetical protein WCC27_13030, partial [Acidobacteriaceae bacterium]